MVEFLSDVRLRILGTRSTLSELQGINTTILKDGALVYVSGAQDVYCLLKESTQAPDGVNIVQPATGTPGRWFATGIAAQANVYATQSDWYVDEQDVTGLASDENVGDTATTPLASYAELTRRIQFATLAQDTTVHLISDVNPTSSLVVRGSIVSPAVFRIIGEATTTLFTGTLTGVQNIVINTSRPFIQIAGIDWATAGPGGTSLVGERVRVTVPAGPADPNTVFWLQEVDSGDPTICYISQPAFVANPPGFSSNESLTIGDQIVVERLTQAGLLYLQPIAVGFRDFLTGTSNISIEHVQGTNDQLAQVILGTSPSVRCSAYASWLSWAGAITVAMPLWEACRIGGDGGVDPEIILQSGSLGLIRAASFHSPPGDIIRFAGSGTINLGSNCSFQETRLVLGGLSDTLGPLSVTIDNAASFWEFASAAIDVSYASRMKLKNRAWGTSTVANSFGIRVRSGGYVEYPSANPPTVAGTAAFDISVGGATALYAALPVAGQDPASNSSWLVVAVA